MFAGCTGNKRRRIPRIGLTTFEHFGHNTPWLSVWFYSRGNFHQNSRSRISLAGFINQCIRAVKVLGYNKCTQTCSFAILLNWRRFNSAARRVHVTIRIWHRKSPNAINLSSNDRSIDIKVSLNGAGISRSSELWPAAGNRAGDEAVSPACHAQVLDCFKWRDANAALDLDLIAETSLQFLASEDISVRNESIVVTRGFPLCNSIRLCSKRCGVEFWNVL